VPLPKCDIALFPSSALGKVDYAAELSGKSGALSEMAAFSGARSCGVFCACLTDSRGLIRKSVAVAERGKLLGISDMLHTLDMEEYKCGASLGIFPVGGYKVGVCIGNDLRFPHCISCLSLCGSNVIAAFCEDVSDGMPPLLIRAYAYLYGVPVVLCSRGVAYFADVAGTVACSNLPQALFEASVKNSYRTVTQKRRGLIPGDKGDF